jgi:protein involved in polysaccharide export with SLBB domain
VRPDGQITLPLVNDVLVAGLTTHEADTKLASLLAVRLVNPEVTVIAAQAHPPTVYVGGEVNNPGAIPIRNADVAIQAISLAGGLRRSASASNIVILRLSDEGKIQSLPLDITTRGQRAPYEALARTRLQADDIVFVPESGRSQVNRFIDDFINHPLQGVNSILGTYVNFRLIQIINKSISQQ